MTQRAKDGDIYKVGPKAGITPIGGDCYLMINKTGAPSVKGSLVGADTTTDEAFELETAADFDPIGIVYEDGIADGDRCWVVYGGVADVLLEDGTGSVHGNWVGVSLSDAGRCDASDTDPPGFVIGHFREVGHSIQTVSSGTDVLCRCMLHFN